MCVIRTLLEARLNCAVECSRWHAIPVRFGRLPVHADGYTVADVHFTSAMYIAMCYIHADRNHPRF